MKEYSQRSGAVTYKDMGFVCVSVVSLLCDEEKSVKQKQSALVLGTLKAKCSLQD